MSDRQQKQKYLRENIEMDQYEDFADFCQNQAGQIDIDQWSFAYVKQLVNKYKSSKAKEQEQHQHERSFANYQTADIQQAYTIVAAIKNSQDPQQQRAGQKSATDLLDSVFEGSQTTSQRYSPNNSPPQINNAQTKYRSSANISSFQNGNIWATTSNVQSSRKSAQFDNFWQFPTSSNVNKQPQQFKTQSPFSNANNNNKNLTSNVQKPQNQVNKPSQKVPSFEQLTQNLNMQKKSGPYVQQAQKPSNMKKSQSPQSLQQATLQTNNKPTTDNNFYSNATNIQKQANTSTNQIKLISQKPLQSTSIKPGNIASAYKMNKIPYTGPAVHKNPFSDTIKCYEAMVRPHLSDRNLSVTIDKHQIVERNFFVSDYVMYFLTVKPIGIVCKRNYEDFTKLRAALQKVYPGVQLPYLQKNSWFQTNLQNIKKQKAMLQFFLHDLIQNPEIRNSRIFQDFLTLTQHKAIKRKFQQYAKMDKFKSLEQLCLLGGKVDVVINQNQRIYHDQLGGFLSTMEDLLNKKAKLIDTLGDQFNAVNSTLINLSKLSQSISEEVKKFNQRVNDFQIPSLQSTFNIVSKSYEQWASRINFESRVVTKRLAPFYRYQKDNIGTLKDLLDCQGSLYKSYIKRSTTQNPVGQSYTSDKLKPYKTGVLEQSKNITVLKYQLGYMSNMVCKQTARFFELMADNFKEKWIYKAQKYKERLGKDMQFYNSIAVMAV